MTAPRFTDPNAAREHLEAVRWPRGATCPHCGVDDVKRLQGKASRPGVYQCNGCREQFTVTVGTVFERSKVPLHKWVLATYLITTSKKGISSHQLHRMLGVTYKTAWFMAHRIREAMRPADTSPMGGEGGTVEVDETFIGRDRSIPKGMGYEHKHKVLALVDRSTGRSRSMVVDKITVAVLTPILQENIARETRLMTDDAGQYRHMHKSFDAHQVVRHTRGEYVNRDDATLHTNTIEGFFAIFKRGMKGIYQHCSKAHLNRYLAEFDFRYSNRSALGVNDAERAIIALQGIEGKRLTYRRTCLAA